MEDTYREVRLLASFIRDFGDDLTDMPYTEQPGNPLKPDNLTDLRTSVRYKMAEDKDGRKFPKGYLFVNNYQRRYRMAAHKDQPLSAMTSDGEQILATFAKRDIEDGDYFFYPFNMEVGEKARLTIDATPVCILRDYDGQGHSAYVFYTDTDRETACDVKGDLAGNVIITLTRSEALHAVKVVIDGRERLVISEGDAVTDRDGNVELYCLVSDGEKTKRPSFRCFPALDKAPEGFTAKNEGKAADSFATGDAFALYESDSEICCDCKAGFTGISETEYSVSVPGSRGAADELFLVLDYEAESAKIRKDSDVMTDSFYTGQDWEIGLKRYFDRWGESEGSFDLTLELTPLTKDAKLYLQEWPDMIEGRACILNKIHLLAQYRIKIS